MIKILDHLKSFAFLMLSILGAFFQKGIDQSNKRQGVQKKKIHIFWWKKMRYMDMIKILGLLKSFAFLMLSILGAFFMKWIAKANKRLF